jgi:2-polyprenyl-6-methoxyphenol hydroxylase-like FAD-dependent oxidoreductase
VLANAAASQSQDTVTLSLAQLEAAPLAHEAPSRLLKDLSNSEYNAFLRDLFLDGKKVPPLLHQVPAVPDGRRVFLAGAGPVGLFSALEALSRGAEVIIVDGREPTRNQVLYLEKPLVDMLRNWVGKDCFQNLIAQGYINYRLGGQAYIAIKHVQFMAHAVLEAQIALGNTKLHMFTGYEFTSATLPDNNALSLVLIPKDRSPAGIMRIEADWIHGTDGTSSEVGRIIDAKIIPATSSVAAFTVMFPNHNNLDQKMKVRGSPIDGVARKTGLLHTGRVFYILGQLSLAEMSRYQELIKTDPKGARGYITDIAKSQVDRGSSTITTEELTKLEPLPGATDVTAFEITPGKVQKPYLALRQPVAFSAKRVADVVFGLGGDSHSRPHPFSGKGLNTSAYDATALGKALAVPDLTEAMEVYRKGVFSNIMQQQAAALEEVTALPVQPGHLLDAAAAESLAMPFSGSKVRVVLTP